MFKPVQQWIKSARTQLVSVPSKFLDEPQTKNGLPRRVVQNMKPDQAAVEIVVSSILDLNAFIYYYYASAFRYRKSI